VFEDLFLATSNKYSSEARSDIEMPSKSNVTDLDEAYSMNVNNIDYSCNKNY
jgi:hypothetical protein